jgi:hypothetical protein
MSAKILEALTGKNRLGALRPVRAVGLKVDGPVEEPDGNR